MSFADSVSLEYTKNIRSHDEINIYRRFKIFGQGKYYKLAAPYDTVNFMLPGEPNKVNQYVYPGIHYM